MRGARRGENRAGARTASSPRSSRESEAGRKARIAPCGRRHLESVSTGPKLSDPTESLMFAVQISAPMTIIKRSVPVEEGI